MKDRKNIVVGLFVLGGLVLLSTLIVWFEGVGVLIRGGYIVSGHFPTARGVRPGKRVHRDGIEIGDVRVVEPSQPQRPGVWIRMRINPGEQVSQDVMLVAQLSTMGDLYLDFQTPAKVRGDWKAAGAANDSPGDHLVQCEFPEGVEIRIGHRVRLDGAVVGSVTDVLVDQDDRPHVAVQMRIDKAVAIPEQALLIAKETSGDEPLIEFQTVEKPPVYLPTDGTAEIEGYVKAPGLLPEELVKNLTELAAPRTLKDVDAKRGAPNLSTAMEQIDITARDFQERLALLDPVLKNLSDLTKPPPNEDLTRKNLWALLAEFQATAANIRDLTQPPETQAAERKNLWAVLKQFDDTAKAAQDLLKNPDSEFGKLLGSVRKSSDDLQKSIARADELLKKADALVSGVQEGKGTLGRLATDDELHRAMVALVENLEMLIDNTNRLMLQWRKEGILSKEGK